MGDVRDPERDQPLPKPGGLPVQEIMIGVIRERREYGKRKYGRPLETHNGRDALKDAWEEALDLFTYLTQLRLERGDVLPGMSGTEEVEQGASVRTSVRQKDPLAELIPHKCLRCGHRPHLPGQCLGEAPSGLANCQCGAEALVERVLGTL
jgi:hypothetical protein